MPVRGAALFVQAFTDSASRLPSLTSASVPMPAPNLSTWPALMPLSRQLSGLLWSFASRSLTQ